MNLFGLPVFKQTKIITLYTVFQYSKKNDDTIFIGTDFMKNIVEYYSSRNFFWCVWPSDRINLGERKKERINLKSFE